MILVADASSKLGQQLIPMLLEKGYQVRTFAGAAGKSKGAQSLGVEVIEGDIRQSDTLLRACEGAEAVVSSVVDTMAIRNYPNTGEIENHLLMEAARRAGASHFVLVSRYGGSSSQPTGPWRIYHRTEEYLKSQRMAYTILQPTAFMETWCARLGRQMLNGREVTIFGDGKNPINFISLQDAAKFIVLALEDPRLCNETLTVGGPQNLTFDDVIAAYEKAFSKCVNRKYISAARISLLSWVYAPFNNAKAHVMAMHHALSTSNWQVDMSETLKHYPINLTCLEDWILKTFHQK